MLWSRVWSSSWTLDRLVCLFFNSVLYRLWQRQMVENAPQQFRNEEHRHLNSSQKYGNETDFFPSLRKPRWIKKWFENSFYGQSTISRHRHSLSSFFNQENLTQYRHSNMKNRKKTWRRNLVQITLTSTQVELSLRFCIYY